MATEREDDWTAMVAKARKAVARLLERQADYVATGYTLDTLQAARVAKEAIDLLAGDPDAAPHALVRVRRMHEALTATVLDTLELEVASAARNHSAANREHVRTALLGAFVARLTPHLVALDLGVHPRRLDLGAVAAVLERWRTKPNRRKGELSAAGVIIALLVLGGDTEENARKRVRRRVKPGKR